jgi:Right handed beta helix region
MKPFVLAQDRLRGIRERKNSWISLRYIQATNVLRPLTLSLSHKGRGDLEPQAREKYLKRRNVMHNKRVNLIVAIMVCCFALGGFASPAAAKPIVVTTLTDAADPPFNADGACGSGTVDDLPGTDGQVSLREAIIAANNTQGADTITFDPSLSGGMIVVNFEDLDADANPDPLPALCGGHTRIKGDLDGDDVPDITLEGGAFPAASAAASAAGISIISSHNTITGLHVQHFPVGIRILAGDATNPGTVTHTTVTNNIVAESKIDGLFVATGNIPDSRLAHTALAHNLVMNNARFGITVVANLSAAGSDTHIATTRITDNEVTGSGSIGIFLFSLGDHNVFSDTTITHNTVAENTSFGINVNGGFGGADENIFDFRIRNNTVTDNGQVGIRVIVGQDNSSHNHVTARIRGNTLERNQLYGIAVAAGEGAVNFPTGTSNQNVLDVWIGRNTVKDHTGGGIAVCGGVGSPNGRAGAVADNNQTHAIVVQNTVADNTDRGIELCAGGFGLASANTVEVWAAHNMVCNNPGTDILGEGGFTGNVLFPVPNAGTGNVLEGEIFKNTATTVTVQNGTPGNTATVTQFHNDPCP